MADQNSNVEIKAKYIVGGQINIDKSDTCQRDLMQYIHSLGTKFRLTPYGDIDSGMEIYGYISRQKRQRQLFPIQQHAQKQKRRNKGKLVPFNVHTNPFHFPRPIFGHDQN